MESLLVADDLDSNNSTFFMVNASHDLAETALAQNVNDLIPIRQMIAHHNIVVAALIIVAEIVGASSVLASVLARLRRSGERADDLPCVARAGEVDAFLLIIDDLAALEDIELASAHETPIVQDRFRGHGLASNGALLDLFGLTSSRIDILPFARQARHLVVSSVVVFVLDDGRKCRRGELVSHGLWRSIAGVASQIAQLLARALEVTGVGCSECIARVFTPPT